jgi:hypothetical protein
MGWHESLSTSVTASRIGNLTRLDLSTCNSFDSRFGTEFGSDADW